jgi:hypothetical protein
MLQGPGLETRAGRVKVDQDGSASGELSTIAPAVTASANVMKDVIATIRPLVWGLLLAFCIL